MSSDARGRGFWATYMTIAIVAALVALVLILVGSGSFWMWLLLAVGGLVAIYSFIRLLSSRGSER